MDLFVFLFPASFDRIFQFTQGILFDLTTLSFKTPLNDLFPWIL